MIDLDINCRDFNIISVQPPYHSQNQIKFCSYCGSYEFYERITDREEHIELERDVYCKVCDNRLNHWSYGFYENEITPEYEKMLRKKIGKIMYDYLGIYNNLKVDEKKCVSKWRPVMANMCMDDKTYTPFVCVFAEKHQIIEQTYIQPSQANYFTSPISPPSFNNSNWMALPVALGLIKDEMFKFMTTDSRLMLNIVSEYYNTVTGKRGLLLENNVRIEDGKILDSKEQERITNLVKKHLDRMIECIIDPSKKKHLQREDKINRILKEV